MLILRDLLFSSFAALLRASQDFHQIIIYMLYGLLWNLNSIVQELLLRIGLAEKAGAYRKRILLRRKPTDQILDIASPLDFFGVHNYPVDCDYVLSDNVTLYCIHGDTAVFVELPKGTDIYNTREHPFFLETQFFKATHAITMSLDKAHSLADKLGDPKERVISLLHTGRAGSTLLAQIFHKTGQVQVLSMPDCYKSLLTKFSHLSTEQQGKLVLTMTRLLCKPVDKYRERSLILLKLKSSDILVVPLLQKSISWMQHICLYRNGLPSVQSLERRMRLVSWNIILEINVLRKLFFCMNMFPYFGQRDTDGVDSNFLVITWRYYSVVSNVIAFKKKFNMWLFKFEDLIASPDDAIQDIFVKCGLSKDLVQTAKSAFDQHSHQMSNLLGGPGRYPSTVYEGEAKIKAECIAKSFQLPMLDSDIRL